MSHTSKTVPARQTKARLLWCLAVLAQGPTGALEFETPAMSVEATAEPKAHISPLTRRYSAYGSRPPRSRLVPYAAHNQERKHR